MKLLVLGGTVFLGRHIVEHALEREHTVTLFNRGRTNPELFPDLELIRGERGGSLSGLQGRSWDAVVDTSGYLPSHVRAAVQALAGGTDQYVFISTISVYEDPGSAPIDEDSPLEAPHDDGITDLNQVTGETYGPLKVGCEMSVRERFPGKSLIIRPGLIVGPHDPTDRFTYWPRRLSRPGQALAPEPPDQPVQFIDVRDLAEWIVHLIENESQGTFNAVGPSEPISMQAFLDRTRAAVEGEAELVWLPAEFLLDAGVKPFSEIPLWFQPGQSGLAKADVSRALAAGLELRPLEETARDTLAWDNQRPPALQRSAGLNPARELALLEAYRAQQAAG